MMKYTIFMNVCKVFTICVYTEGYLPLQLVVSICFMGNVESDVKQIDWLLQVVVFLQRN